MGHPQCNPGTPAPIGEPHPRRPGQVRTWHPFCTVPVPTPEYWYRPGSVGSTHYATSPMARRRVTLGLSSAEVARRAGLDPSYIAHLEAGDKRPSLEVVPRLAAALDVPTDELVGWFVPTLNSLSAD